MPGRQIAKLVWIYKVRDLGLPGHPVSKDHCRVGIVHKGRGHALRQCSRSPTTTRQHEGEELGMCQQHAAAWDAYQATKRTPKP